MRYIFIYKYLHLHLALGSQILELIHLDLHVYILIDPLIGSSHKHHLRVIWPTRLLEATWTIVCKCSKATCKFESRWESIMKRGFMNSMWSTKPCHHCLFCLLDDNLQSPFFAKQFLAVLVKSLKDILEFFDLTNWNNMIVPSEDLN